MVTSRLSREYMPLAVNVLAHSPKISDMTKRHVLQLNFCLIDQKKG